MSGPDSLTNTRPIGNTHPDQPRTEVTMRHETEPTRPEPTEPEPAEPEPEGDDGEE
jgi:hypothetical protein